MEHGGAVRDSPEQFVLRSGVRTGLKREFSFAMRAQSELSLSSCSGRTRSSFKKSKLSEPLDLAARPSPVSSELEYPVETKKIITYKRRNKACLEKKADVAKSDPLSSIMDGQDEPVQLESPVLVDKAVLKEITGDGNADVVDQVYTSARRFTRSMVGPLLTQRNSVNCEKCKVSFLRSRDSKFGALCDSCIEIGRTVKESSDFLPTDYSLCKKASLVKKAKSFSQLTRKDLGLHKNIFKLGIEGMIVEYCNVSKNEDGKEARKNFLGGYVKNPGIFCYCCSTVISPSQFEAHAGYASRRKPYHHIYTSTGDSLHSLSVKASKDKKLSPKKHDDACTICMDGGNFLLCASCPRVYHLDCLGLASLPQGKYHCRYCKAHKVSNTIGSIDQIVKQCVRIDSSQDNSIIGCALCKGLDFSKGKFDDRTVLLCDQCEKEYHVGCLSDHNMADLTEVPIGEWFCSTKCKRIHKILKDVVLGGPDQIGQCDLDLIKKKRAEKGLNGEEELDLKWRLLSPKWTQDDCKKFFSKAVNIFHESFAPIVDAATQKDLIPSMVYGRKFGHLDYSGMYCAVLTQGSSVVSVGLLRVIGCEISELPLVATTTKSQGLGYFQALFSSIERLLGKLEMKHFVLPAANKALSIWTSKFGFSPITSHKLRQCLQESRRTVFQDTSTLHKPVPPL